MRTPELESFVQCLNALNQSLPRTRLKSCIETVRLIRWSRQSIRSVEAALSRAVQERTHRLEALGGSAVESPDQFMISGVFNFKDAITHLDEERLVSAEQSAQLRVQLQQEIQTFSQDSRLLRARLAGLRATEESLRNCRSDHVDTSDPLAAEIQKCVLQISSLAEELQELEATRTKAIAELELAHQNLESRTTHLGNRASAIRRDLGRALLENEAGESMAPEVRQAKKAADTVDKLLDLRRDWVKESERIDRTILYRSRVHYPYFSWP